jgi:hypothetical protein
MNAVCDKPRRTPWPQARSLPRFQNIVQPPPPRGRYGVQLRGARPPDAHTLATDSAASVVGFLATHPRSTVGDLAQGLNLDPEHVATCLTQLTGSGEIYKASHGYTTQQPA